MSITIDGVPESITREQFLDIPRQLGFDPYKIDWIHFDHTGVTCQVKAKGPDGKPYEAGSNELAKHTVHIKVED